jgi:glycosyltransferase involved in cell wall biosynthesis
LNANLVSTIIPVYNRPALLHEAVDSVLAQTHRPIEIIIVDDGSTDSTPAVIRGLADAHPGIVVALRQDNAGPGVAREAGRLRARGGFIQYLDSDDLLLPEKFALQVAGLQRDTEAGISYGIVLDEDRTTGARTVTHGTDVARRTLFPAVLGQRIWHTISPLYRRSASDAIGRWSPRRILEDWDHDCRAGMLGIRLHHCAQAVAVSRDGGDDHAGFAWKSDPRAMRDRVFAYTQALKYAQAAGVPPDSAEMQRFVRSLFWMARETGRLGFEAESRRLFELARAHTAGRHAEYAAFSLAARLLGWRRASMVASSLTRSTH